LDFGDCHKSLLAHDDSVMSVQFVPNTHYFFSASKDGSIKYWDADKYEHIMTLEGHHNEIWAMAIGREGNLLISGGQDRSIRFWHQTDTQLFLDSQRQLEMEEAWDRDLEQEEDKFQLTDELEVGTAARASIESIKQGERILEAIDTVEEERIQFELYQKELAAAEKELPRAVVSQHKKDNKPLIPPPVPSVLLLGKSPSEYLLWVVTKIKTANLESALIILPFSQVLVLFSYLEKWVKENKEIVLCCRILYYLLRIHQVQISANKSLLSTLLSLQQFTRKYLQQQKDTMNYNLAVMNYLKREIEHSDTKDFF